MKRKPGALLPIELAILAAGVGLRRHGVSEFHGFSIAKKIAEHADARRLTAYGTLYKALERLEGAGLLTSRWEDPLIAATETRPRRRLYQLTAAAEGALIGKPSPQPRPASRATGRPVTP